MVDTKKAVKPEKKSRVLEILSKEYKYENIVLMFLAVFAIVLGALILNGTLTIGKVFLIGSYPKVFAWLLVALGTISLLLVVWPFYKPSLLEFKRISFLKKKEFFQNVLQVFIFVVILSAVFLLYDLVIKALIDLMV